MPHLAAAEGGSLPLPSMPMVEAPLILPSREAVSLSENHIELFWSSLPVVYHDLCVSFTIHFSGFDIIRSTFIR